MNLAELENLTTASDRYSYEEASIEGPDGEEIKGVIVSDSKVDTAIHITFGALLKLDWSGLCAAAACGKDVDHITRVTGYFSRTSGWNKGKEAELRDRHRTRM
jgi:hypothetical protein